MFYDETEARKYTSNSRIIEVQEKMTERALELLALPEGPCLLLDLGCGSGLSGQALEENGHHWVGIDISEAMVNVAVERELEQGDLLVGDLGHGLPFKAGSFDGAISISALQWLCNADKSSHIPAKRLLKLFSSLYSCLRRGSKAVLQFYPENDKQAELITQQAMRAGFTGGLVVDFPNSSKAKKVFLVLFTGGTNNQLPQPQTLEQEAVQRMEVDFGSSRGHVRRGQGLAKPAKKSKEWVLQKKERRRRQGKEVRQDTKYTGRKRSKKF
jgi:18S rRNA (guanine1575-N7)-methyltransferase